MSVQIVLTRPAEVSNWQNGGSALRPKLRAPNPKLLNYMTKCIKYILKYIPLKTIEESQDISQNEIGIVGIQ